MRISRCGLPPTGGEAYDRNTSTNIDNKITFHWSSISNYRYVCLNYSNSRNDEQTKITNKKTHL